MTKVGPIYEAPFTSFDFDRVVAVMKAVRWKYGDKGVPSADFLRRDVVRWMRELKGNPTWKSIGSGSLSVTRDGVVQFWKHSIKGKQTVEAWKAYKKP
jgi:hypothetical protein